MGAITDRRDIKILRHLKDGRKSGGKPKKRWQRIMVTISKILVGILVLIVGAVGAGYWLVSNNFDKSKTTLSEVFPEEDGRPEKLIDGSQNILLLGTDTRGEIGDTLDDVGGARSDTIMLVHISANNEIRIISILRDSWVELPGFGKTKINAALAKGGVPLAVRTIESLMDTRIDHVAVIDFGGFRELSSALGGVPVNNTSQFVARGEYYEAGPLTLSGERALSYVRERYSFIDGDYQRVKNQQIFIKGVMTKLASRQVLTNPTALSNTISTLGEMMATDQGFNFDYLARMALRLQNFDLNSITFHTIPTTGVGFVGKQSVVFLDWDELPAFRDQVLKN